MNCPTCGADNDADYQICDHCGTPQPYPVPDGAVLTASTPAEEKEKNTWVCLECGQENSTDESVCALCGLPREKSRGIENNQYLEIKCHTCGSLNRDGLKYCEQCGAELSDEAARAWQGKESGISTGSSAAGQVDEWENRDRKNRFPIWIPAGCMVLILFSGCAFVVLLFQLIQH
ncbi:MAG: zinc ribbon domain-containing protein [Anaerolineales bacterium]|nr:zinc ribbon domain-containing protein [Anaerolineales bacterium]